LAWRYVQPVFNLLPGVFEYSYNKPVDTDVHALFDAIVNDWPLDRLTLEQALYQFPEWADLYSGVDPNVVWLQTQSNVYNSNQYNSSQYNNNSQGPLPESALVDGSEPRAICQVTPDKYVVLPLPDADRVYTMRMFYALKPKRNSSGMDEVAFNELEDVIMHGALQHLLVLPNTNWSDRELASYHARQYVFQIAERRARANLGNMRGVMSARMQRFGI
jgi:hypothetical protein